MSLWYLQNNTIFYLFLSDKKFICVIYYFIDDGKLFLNAFSIRKSFTDNLSCLSLSTKFFATDIYAEAQNRASALCLLRSGFKRVDGNLFCLRYEKNKFIKE